MMSGTVLWVQRLSPRFHVVYADVSGLCSEMTGRFFRREPIWRAKVWMIRYVVQEPCELHANEVFIISTDN
jgi:hypothetical protein